MLGHDLVPACETDERRENAPADGVQVVDVDLVELRPRANLALGDVARPTDEIVVRSENIREERSVDVVEPSARLAEPALLHERAEQKRLIVLDASHPAFVVPIHPCDEDSVAGLDLVQALP